jgi:hypothetical protein
MPSPTTLHTIEPGVDLIDRLAELGRSGEGWIQGTGHVEAVELRVAGEGADPVRSIRGRLTLLQLSGPSGGPFSATLARATDVGIEVLGGVLVQARSAGVSLSLQKAGNAPMVPARVVGPPAAEAEAPAASPAQAVGSPTQASASVWVAAAAANARARARDAREADEVEQEHFPEAGDLVEHFAFGRCDVLTADGERLRIRDVGGPGRVREVSLAMLKVTGPTESNGKRLFRLVRKGPGGG